MRKPILAWAFILVLVAFAIHAALPSGPTVTIASWNLQVFGDTKAGQPDLLAFYAERIAKYDIMIIQEIRDADGSAWTELCGLLINYSCVNSSRAGRSASKEQYGIAYRDGITLRSLRDHNPAYARDFERPPLRADFSLDGMNLTLYTIHIKPDDAPREITLLEELVDPAEPTIVLGDLNADCRYYDEDDDVAFMRWFWAIPDREDTTVGKSDCAYDRIILNDAADPLHVRSGVDSEGILKIHSDHYIVWTELRP